MEQVKAEPVAWMYEHPEGHINVTAREDARSSCEGWLETPLYTTPQPAAVDDRLLAALQIIANPDWSWMTAADAREHATEALAQIERKPEDGNG